MSFSVTSLSSKGQVVIPGEIREQLDINAGAKFIITTDGENLLLKPVEEPDIDSFEELIKKSRKIIEKEDIKKEDVKEIIKEVRDENNS